MRIRNQKTSSGGVVFYRMQRGGYVATLAVNEDELELARDAVARKLRRTRKALLCMCAQASR